MSFGENLNGYYDVGCQLPEYLKNKAMGFLNEEARIKDSIQTLEEFEERRNRVRKFFLDSIGGIDIEKTPLNDICTGVVERDSYLIKKIIFQSQPGVYVTSNLYMPKGIEGKVPAVIFTSGHTEAAKASPRYQKVCIDLVKNGFVVLSVDPISQGERMQSFDKEAGRTLVRWHAEHTYLGLQCELTGHNIIRYFLWDLIRAVDYLYTLPEVDTSRIGVTGNSGGGMQTTFMMMGEERIKAAAPCTYISSREGYMKTGQPQDGEQISFGAISQGINFDDYITCFAPRPVMIGAVESDFFVLEGTLQAFERAKKVYRLYGCEENVKLGLAKGTHSFNDELRQLVVNWFIETLKGEPGSFITDPDMPVEDYKTLQCTKSGQVLAEFDDAVPVFKLIVDYYRKHKYSYTNNQEEIKKRLYKLLNMPQCSDRFYPRIISTRQIDNSGKLMPAFEHKDIFFFTEKDILAAGTYISVQGRTSDFCTLLIMDEGVNQIYKENDLINQLLEKGDVFAFDPRGAGVVRNRPVNGRPFYEMFGTEYKLNCDAIMMEMSLMGLRVFDIIRACDYLKQENPEIKIGVAGKGISAIYSLMAGILRDDVEYIYLENMISSFEEIACKQFYYYDARYSIYGILKELDIPMIIDAFKKDKKIVSYQEPNVGNIIRW